jgi:hypothetical protein
MQALARLLGYAREFFKTHRGIDEIPKHCFAHGGLAGEIGIDRLREKSFSKAWITCTRAATELLNSRVRAISISAC